MNWRAHTKASSFDVGYPPVAKATVAGGDNTPTQLDLISIPSKLAPSIIHNDITTYRSVKKEKLKKSWYVSVSTSSVVACRA
ncbi:hypothetical protein PISMIDRAFT_677251 [Pisolithus microcarpus 441]|uniref:Uncharacterized protein n=1 Tax=Pisolithus microcarpus 441 TaxID=765257 RepID=A0A0C9Z8H6_9AGAM|nr:hypothetical protein PISMIDRAFT_677251 [Pisolithus microcarpus 441]